jgi:hypothetical protein
MNREPRRSPMAAEAQGLTSPRESSEKTQETGVIFDQYHPGGVWQQLVEVFGGQEQ